jgi:hypothetical protein
VAEWHLRDSGGLVIYQNPQFSQSSLSKLQVLLFTIGFDVTLSAANWYVLHKFTLAVC